MSGIAIAVLSGNLTRDAELNDSGRVLSFSIACNRREKGQDGEYEDKPHYFDCKVLGNRAAPLAGMLTKGRGVTVQGDLVQERWEKDGQKRSAVRVLVREVVPHGSKAEAGSSGRPSGGAQATMADDPDIPFAPSVI